MSGSVFGKNFTIATWGESHGEAVGVVVDGCPAGLPLTVHAIQRDLDRRKPGQSAFATARVEADAVQILSGVFEGVTTGTPISLLIPNTNQRSRDYSQIARCYRPGHADYTYDRKYAWRDYRGGGRSSGRETAARVAAGAIARQLLGACGVDVMAFTKSIGPITVDPDRFQRDAILNNPFAMPDTVAAGEAGAYVQAKKAEDDSVGGVVECWVQGTPEGLGEPVFEKLDAMLGQALLSIGGVKAVEIGSGVRASQMCGSEHNDPLRQLDGTLIKESNHAGGIVGGISDGFPLILRATFKPTPSIARAQRTVDQEGQNTSICISGRHDPTIVPRAVVVVEAMTALVLADYLLQRVLSRLDLLQAALGVKKA